MIRLGPHGREFCLNESRAAGEMVSVSPVVIVPKDQLPREHALWAYAFHWDDHCYALPLGELTIAKHSDDPNTYVVRVPSSNGPWVGLRAIRDIPAGEAITHKYREVWF